MPFNGVMPAIRPKIAPFGLLSVADVTEHALADSHWANGFSYETVACNFKASVLQICLPGQSEYEIVDMSDNPRWGDYRPFAIVVEDTCSTIGWTAEDRRQRVMDKLDLMTQRALEAMLWGGSDPYLGPTYPNVADEDENQHLIKDAKMVGNGSTSLGLGLALLEQALGNCGAGAQGVIHMTRSVASLLDTHVQPEDNVLQTKNNHNLVVSGSGYFGWDGTVITKDGYDDDPTKQMMYATGPIVAHLGAKELLTPDLAQGAFNSQTNEVTLVASRPAAVYWDGCCHFGVQVDLTSCGCELGGITFDMPL